MSRSETPPGCVLAGAAGPIAAALALARAAFLGQPGRAARALLGALAASFARLPGRAAHRHALIARLRPRSGALARGRARSARRARATLRSTERALERVAAGLELALGALPLGGRAGVVAQLVQRFARRATVRTPCVRSGRAATRRPGLADAVSPRSAASVECRRGIRKLACHGGRRAAGAVGRVAQDA